MCLSSVRRCPQLSTLVRDHSRKSLCPRSGLSCHVPKSNPSCSAWGGGPVELSLDLPNDVRGGGKRRSGGNVSVGRSAAQVVPHSLTHSLTHSQSRRQLQGWWMFSSRSSRLSSFLKSPCSRRRFYVAGRNSTSSRWDGGRPAQNPRNCYRFRCRRSQKCRLFGQLSRAGHKYKNTGKNTGCQRGGGGGHMIARIGVFCFY